MSLLLPRLQWDDDYVPHRPRVMSPVASLFEQDGVEIALISVEVWANETIVRLAALVDDPAAEEETYAETLNAWAAAGRRDAVPEEPGGRFYRELSVLLSDDLGTEYTWRNASYGGSGRLFRGEWYFTRGVPDEAARLRVEAHGEGSGGSYELALG